MAKKRKEKNVKEICRRIDLIWFSFNKNHAQMEVFNAKVSFSNYENDTGVDLLIDTFTAINQIYCPNFIVLSLAVQGGMWVSD